MMLFLISKELMLMGDKFWISVDLPIKLSRRKGGLRRKKYFLKWTLRAYDHVKWDFWTIL